ncbi:MAG TPA: tetratricopeptide repeat protein, partial [Chthoniobacterales bacterium]
LAALAYGASRKGSWQNVRVFGALWFLLAYLPISNLVELNANVAEHWLYLPSVGFLLFAAGIVLELGARARVMSIALASLAVCALGTRAYVRSTDWVTPKTFFERTIAAGGSSSRAAVNLALIYAHEGQDAKAEAIFRRVLEIAPDYAVARNGLAAVLCRQGKRSEGEATYVANQASISQAPKEANTWFAVLGLARLRHEQDDDAGAIEVLQRGRRLYPHIWELVRAESELLRQINRPDAALRLVAQFAEANWWHHGSSLAIGRLLAEKGEADAAVEALQFASWLDVHDAESLNLVALIRVRQERLEDARAAQKRAVARRPDEPRQYRLLADILQKMGRSAEAERAAAKVASLTALADPQVRVN